MAKLVRRAQGKLTLCIIGIPSSITQASVTLGHAGSSPALLAN